MPLAPVHKAQKAANIVASKASVTATPIRWLLATLVLLLTLLAYFVQDRHRQAQLEAALQTRNLVQLLETHLADDFDRVDRVLTYAAKGVGQPAQQQRLIDLQASFPMIAGLSVFDARGLLIESSDPSLKNISIADRTHFQRLRDDPKATVVFSEAQLARTTGQWSVVQARARRDAEGRFLGTVNAEMSLEHIGKLFGTVDVGAKGIVLLRQSDTFKLLQRVPRNNESDFNQPLPKNNATRQRIEAGERAGTLSFTASTDGVERLASFKVMDHFPFYVQVALSKTDYLAAWRRDAVVAAALGALLLAGFMFAMRRLQKSAAVAQAATRQLAESELNFRTFYNGINDFLFVLSMKGDILYSNQYVTARLHYTADELVGQSVLAVHPPERREEAMRIVTEMMAGTATHCPVPLQAKDGSLIPVETRVVSGHWNGQPALFGLSRDMSERKRAEEAVRDLLNRFQMLAAHLPGFVYQYQLMPDGSSHFPYASPGIEAIYGVSPETVVKDASRVFVVIHPDDLARIGASIRHSADTLTLWHESYRVQHQGGPLLWVEGHATPVRQSDGSTLWHGYIHDVSEQKNAALALAQQSQRLSNILWGTGVGTWEWNVQTGETRFNERWAEQIGYTLDELAPVSIATWMKLAHPDDLAASSAALKKHFSNVDAAYELESRLRHKLGHWIWVLDRGKLISRTPDGLPEWMAGTHWDITERKQAEHIVQQQTQALARSNAELEQFAYVASHDLRQPLRMVNSYVQMLERRLSEKLDDDTRKMMHFATEGAARMDQMLVSLLEYSRVGRKGEPLSLLDSRAAVDEALRFLAPAIAQAQAAVRVSGDWPQIVASRDEFTRLWQNLIGNAVKYRAPDRVPVIDITVLPDAQGWLFCVADNGIGIDPAQFDRLFKVFQRLQTRDQYEGNGIGLAVARKIVERHGGSIWGESDGLGLGCRFCFNLPERRLDTEVLQ